MFGILLSEHVSLKDQSLPGYSPSTCVVIVTREKEDNTYLLQKLNPARS